MGKAENVCSSFPIMFSNNLFFRVVKTRNCGVRSKTVIILLHVVPFKALAEVLNFKL